MKKRALVTFLLVLCIVLTMIPTAYARDSVEVDHDGSLTIYYAWEGMPLPGCTFHVWKVATVDKNFAFTPTEAFASYDVSWDNDAEGWNQIAYTLLSYAQRDKIPEECTLKTGADGYTAKQSLPTGMYLFFGDDLEYNGYTYHTVPTLVIIPTVEEDESLNYDVVASPKQSRDPIPIVIELETVRALKVWKNDSASERPRSIEVQLLQNGDVYDTVELNEKNSWRYTWVDLDPSCTWTVVEKSVPSGYTVRVEKEGITYVITNTAKVVPPPTPPVPPIEPTPIPQTGQLWWPVPLMAFIGLMFLAFGLIRRRSEQ